VDKITEQKLDELDEMIIAGLFGFGIGLLFLGFAKGVGLCIVFVAASAARHHFNKKSPSES
jgi:hypothetical protein